MKVSCQLYLSVLVVGHLVPPDLDAGQPKGEPEIKLPRLEDELGEIKLPRLLKAGPVKIDPKEDELVRLLKARHNAAVAEIAFSYRMFIAGAKDFTFESLFEVGQRLTDSGVELSENPAQKVDYLDQLFEFTTLIEKNTEARVELGKATTGQLERARYFRLDAQLRLLRAKREAEKAK